MLEIARALVICVEGGWKPRRTIMFARYNRSLFPLVHATRAHARRVSRSWDGEEYGLLGSVEFVEKHAHILNAQAVAYINVDFGVKGTTKLQAKGTLTPPFFAFFFFFFFWDSSSTDRRIVVGWGAGTPNLQSLLASVVEKVSMPDGRQVREVWEDGKVGPLGATSDFMPFLQVRTSQSSSLQPGT
jgi:N-acetylated-alpha-linked acidic dipeptidase